MPNAKDEDKNFQEAKRYLAQFPLRSAQEERDSAADWMGSCRSFQQSLDQALLQLEQANKEALEMRVTIEQLTQELRAKDTSFKPTLGQA
jgi:hypothetical protein